MVLKNSLNVFNLLLSLGAFYLGSVMFLGLGAFDTFPPEWLGKLPFQSWETLALSGVIIFGIGNLIASIYGFIKKNRKLFIFSIMMGAIFFICASIPIIVLGEWYLPTVQFFILSVIQMSLGVFGLTIERLKS